MAARYVCLHRRLQPGEAACELLGMGPQAGPCRVGSELGQIGVGGLTPSTVPSRCPRHAGPREVRASGGPRTTELRPHLRGPRHGEVTACAAPAGGIPGEHTGKTVQVLRPLKSARAWGGRRPSRPVLIKGLGSLQRPRGRGRRQVCRGQHCFARCLPATAATLTGGGGTPGVGESCSQPGRMACE